MNLFRPHCRLAPASHCLISKSMCHSPSSASPYVFTAVISLFKAHSPLCTSLAWAVSSRLSAGDTAHDPQQTPETSAPSPAEATPAPAPRGRRAPRTWLQVAEPTTWGERGSDDFICLFGSKSAPGIRVPARPPRGAQQPAVGVRRPGLQGGDARWGHARPLRPRSGKGDRLTQSPAPADLGAQLSCGSIRASVASKPSTGRLA